MSFQGKSKALDICDSFHSFVFNEGHGLCYKLQGGAAE